MKKAVHLFVANRSGGMRNDEVARELGLKTSFNNGQRNYLTFVILNELVKMGRLQREKCGPRIYYRASLESEGTASPA